MSTDTGVHFKIGGKALIRYERRMRHTKILFLLFVVETKQNDVDIIKLIKFWGHLDKEYHIEVTKSIHQNLIDKLYDHDPKFNRYIDYIIKYKLISDLNVPDLIKEPEVN